VLSASVTVTSFNAGTAIESLKTQVGELRSVLQLTYASQSRVPCVRVQLSLFV
jgi:hypothetical protein